MWVKGGLRDPLKAPIFLMTKAGYLIQQICDLMEYKVTDYLYLGKMLFVSEFSP